MGLQEIAGRLHAPGGHAAGRHTSGCRAPVRHRLAAGRAAVGIVLLVASITAVAGLAWGAPARAAAEPVTVRIAFQYGLVYAPLMVARQREILEKHGLRPEWLQLGSGGAMREALLSGRADVAFMGIPPFLLGWDKDVPWKVAMGFQFAPFQLVTYHSGIRSLRDFKPQHRIAIPSPGSVQHILLAMAAARELGSPKALDPQLVAMSHPDAMMALVSRRGVDAHFATPPYLFEELNQPGFHAVLDAERLLPGGFSFNVGVVTERFRRAAPQGYQALLDAMQESVDWINAHPDDAAALLAPAFKLSAEVTRRYLTWPGMRFTLEVRGLVTFARAMRQLGMMRRELTDWSAIAWDNVPPERELVASVAGGR